MRLSQDQIKEEKKKPDYLKGIEIYPLEIVKDPFKNSIAQVLEYEQRIDELLSKLES